MKENSVRNLIIIGSGPAGLTAAIYASRALLEPLVVAGRTPGGQLMITSEVENFPGFPESILGPELMVKMREQATRFGTDFIDDDVTSVDFSRRPFAVTVGEQTYRSRSVIIATGASALWLGIESEKKFMGKGVSGCATCDGAFFRNVPVAVIGGGDSALEEALFLTRYASHVTIVHRRDRLRASPYMQRRAETNEKISFVWNSVVKEITGDKKVDGVILEDVRTGEERRLNVGGVFIAIGHRPNTDIFKGQIPLDEKGYIIVHDGSRTGVEGVFASGDVHDHRYRQAITAAGMGCISALDAQRFLEETESHASAEREEETQKA
ncbi:MAG: thioredoxin-disulfide reductase [Thermoplasmata archaeon]|uniref:Thioredoxin-disulfide reductase n=1 Tax=Candidatus Sysuiplasma superficiale TaxID=2823368 RepID=A0A8J7YNN4_9ARCH|nr:thioredoxin-disulfide reductase [Candidatus Sysuiplasma superficiale]MBX8644275.1 thioredoxin-disulfide reductase [Candidatus Sysuiplasma superficiale]MCL4347108.1 thioredoxin-disulfide reductase [Candidatus Thermoplasmatota archaeon]